MTRNLTLILFLALNAPAWGDEPPPGDPQTLRPEVAKVETEAIAGINKEIETLQGQLSKTKEPAEQKKIQERIAELENQKKALASAAQTAQPGAGSGGQAGAGAGGQAGGQAGGSSCGQGGQGSSGGGSGADAALLAAAMGGNNNKGSDSSKSGSDSGSSSQSTPSKTDDTAKSTDTSKADQTAFDTKAPTDATTQPVMAKTDTSPSADSQAAASKSNADDVVANLNDQAKQFQDMADSLKKQNQDALAAHTAPPQQDAKPADPAPAPEANAVVSRASGTQLMNSTPVVDNTPTNTSGLGGVTLKASDPLSFSNSGTLRGVTSTSGAQGRLLQSLSH